MSVETAWDYLFYSYKANLPLEGSFRSDLDKLHRAVNVVVESELKDKQKHGAVEELKIILKSIKTELKNRQEFFLTRMDKCNKLRLEINTLEGIEKKQAVKRRINLWENIKEDIGYYEGVKMIILKIERRLKELKEGVEK